MTEPSPVRVLFVDDEPDSWLGLIEEILEPACHFDTKPNDGDTLNWVSQADVADLYDIAICNIYNARIRAPIGLAIITKLKQRFPDLPVIVLTGFEPPTKEERRRFTQALAQDQGVAYIAWKRGGGFDLTDFREKFEHAIRARNGRGIAQTTCVPPAIAVPSTTIPHTSTPSLWESWEWKSTDGRYTIPDGVVRDILSGLGDILPSESFSLEFRNDICMLAGAPEENRRLKSAVDIWEKLWLQEAGLPYLPLMQRLAQQQKSGTMYPGYRDHVAHSIWMYLLGLYLYRSNRVISQAITRKFLESEFLRAWKIATLFHDIGYTYDKGIDQEPDAIQPILDELKTFTIFPLRLYLGSRGLELSEKDENELALIGKRSVPLVVDLDNLERLSFLDPEVATLDLIEDLGYDAKLSQVGYRKPFGSYYRFARNVKPANRERFRDHGILSALILLYEFHYFHHCLDILHGKIIPESLPRKIHEELQQLTTRRVTQDYAEIVRQAAAAIALHNIDKGIWKEARLREQAKSPQYRLSLDDYQIDLAKSPLAFLLALTDVLQCWDRPKSLYTDIPTEFSVPSDDVHIQCKKDIIFWSVRSDSAAGKRLIHPSAKIQEMSDYLGTGIQSLIQEC